MEEKKQNPADVLYHLLKEIIEGKDRISYDLLSPLENKEENLENFVNIEFNATLKSTGKNDICVTSEDAVGAFNIAIFVEYFIWCVVVTQGSGLLSCVAVQKSEIAGHSFQDIGKEYFTSDCVPPLNTQELQRKLWRLYQITLEDA